MFKTTTKTPEVTYSSIEMLQLFFIKSLTFKKDHVAYSS